jgi:hypothetical protein
VQATARRLQAAAAAAAAVPLQALVTVPAELEPQSVRTSLLASPLVKAVVRNTAVSLPRIAAAAAAPCSGARAAAGISNAAWNSSRFDWSGCLNSNTSIAFFGERCGSNWNRFRWTGIYSVRRSTGQLYSSSCVWLRANKTNDTALAKFFGDCGVAPLLFPEVPTTVCKEATGGDGDAVSAFPPVTSSADW